MFSSKTQIVVGLTGGIATGKSTVAKTFDKHGISNIDADIIARKVVEIGSIGLQSIVNCFSKQVLKSDGSLNRALLGEIVFQDAKLLEQLNNIMLPLIQKETDSNIEVLKNQGHSIIIYNAALLCETGHANKYRPLIVVNCTLEHQLERLMARGTGHGPLTQERAMLMINSQMPAAQKAEMANYVIDTSGSIQQSIQQTEKIIVLLKNMIVCEACILEQQLDVLIVEPHHTCRN